MDTIPEFKGTEGNWGSSQDACNSISITSDGETIAEVISNNHSLSNEDFANAKLMAASKKMAEALSEAYEELKFHNWHNTTTGYKILSVLKEASL